MDELALPYRIALSDPTDLPLADGMHRFISFDRSASTLDRSEAKARRDPLLDESMVLLDYVVKERRPHSEHEPSTVAEIWKGCSYMKLRRVWAAMTDAELETVIGLQRDEPYCFCLLMSLYSSKSHNSARISWGVDPETGEGGSMKLMQKVPVLGELARYIDTG